MLIKTFGLELGFSLYNTNKPYSLIWTTKKYAVLLLMYLLTTYVLKIITVVKIDTYKGMIETA